MPQLSLYIGSHGLARGITASRLIINADPTAIAAIVAYAPIIHPGRNTTDAPEIQNTIGIPSNRGQCLAQSLRDIIVAECEIGAATTTLTEEMVHAAITDAEQLLAAYNAERRQAKMDEVRAYIEKRRNHLSIYDSYVLDPASECPNDLRVAAIARHEQLEADRIAEAEAEEAETEAKAQADAEAKAQAEANMQSLRDWALSDEGTERARLAVETNLDEWERVCSLDYADAHLPDGYAWLPDQADERDRTQPTVDELRELKRLQALVSNWSDAAHCPFSDPRLKWIVIDEDIDDDGDATTPADKYGATLIDISSPTGRTYVAFHGFDS